MALWYVSGLTYSLPVAIHMKKNSGGRREDHSAHIYYRDLLQRMRLVSLWYTANASELQLMLARRVTAAERLERHLQNLTLEHKKKLLP